MSNQLVINDLLKQAFGLNRFVTHVARNSAAQSFPPYNIIVDDEVNPSLYTLELAVAGFSKEQISVKVRKDTGLSILTIEGAKEDQPSRLYLNNGLAARRFTREFTMSDDATVNSVSLKDGILTIEVSVKPVENVEKTFTIN